MAARVLERGRASWHPAVWVAGLAAFALGGCRQDMHDQPRYKPLAESGFFGDARASRPPVEGTVARGQLIEDKALTSGRDGNTFAAVFPFPLDEQALRRGQDRYRIHCRPCHGVAGEGDGIVVQRGFRKPASFHEQRLRTRLPGYFFDVMTNGFATMSDYASQISPEDRWKIAGYIRVLQRSRNATIDDVPEQERPQLAAPARPAAGEEHR